MTSPEAARPEAPRYLASAPRGCVDLLAHELRALGVPEVREQGAGVSFGGELAAAYRTCLWSRLANRVFLLLAEFEAPDAAAFHAAVARLDWSAHLASGATLACSFSGRHPLITHTQFGALKLKDGIVDALRSATGSRPDVSVSRPDVHVHAHARGARITLALDLSGESLHRRGYRGAAGAAPLKENVAAGILMRARWPQLHAQGATLLDPLCGSGTFCIEAALMAADRAPGLLREYYGFLGWRGHDAPLWERLRAEALARAAAQVPMLVARGQDQDPAAIAAASANAARAGVAEWTQWRVAPLASAAPVAGEPAGLLCTNPPYGVRLEDGARACELLGELGALLRARFSGWKAAILIGTPEHGRELGLRAARSHVVWNGGLECRLLRIEVDAANERAPGRLGRGAEAHADSPGARMFANRLAKNLKRLGGWAQRHGISCYRLYDADMPEYAFALDRYQVIEPAQTWLYVQEYAAPKEIAPEAVRRRRAEVLGALPAATGVPAERIALRTRRRMRRGEQYVKHDAQGRFHLVLEAGLRFWVNFGDYLDTGLFLDQRLTRARLRDAAAGASFLNLFAYTGTATVYAHAGGAARSVSVDLSRTYLEWAQRNLHANGFERAAAQYVQADCLAWLASAATGTERFDLIFLDPPTFSNSKRMSGVLDVQRDHAALIERCVALLRPGGLLLFSTNAQRFRLDAALAQRHQVQDLSAATLPQDFARHARIHRCYALRAAAVP